MFGLVVAAKDAYRQARCVFGVMGLRACWCIVSSLFLAVLAISWFEHHSALSQLARVLEYSDFFVLFYLFGRL